MTDLPEKEKKPEKREERVAVRVVERKGGRDGDPGPPPSESSFLLCVARMGCWAGCGVSVGDDDVGAERRRFTPAVRRADACAAAAGWLERKVRVSRVDLGR